MTDRQAMIVAPQPEAVEAGPSWDAIAWLLGEGSKGDDGTYDVLCLSGRGDKDLAEVLGMEEVQ